MDTDTMERKLRDLYSSGDVQANVRLIAPQAITVDHGVATAGSD